MRAAGVGAHGGMGRLRACPAQRAGPENAWLATLCCSHTSPARVAMHVALRDMNLDVSATDGRRIEVVANGLPIWRRPGRGEYHAYQPGARPRLATRPGSQVREVPELREPGSRQTRAAVRSNCTAMDRRRLEREHASRWSPRAAC